MGIEIKINVSASARQLKRDHPYMSERDIAEFLEAPTKLVMAALKRKEARDQPKSRLVSGGALRGPLTAGEVAEKLRVSVAHASRVTGGLRVRHRKTPGW